MKDLLAYTAGVVLVGYIGYVFISSDEPTRVNRACIPAAAATRLIGATVRILDEESGESLARGTPQEVLVACRNALWYWAKDSRTPPSFPESDALFGSYGSQPAEASVPVPAGIKPISSPTNAGKTASPVKPADEEDRL